MYALLLAFVCGTPPEYGDLQLIKQLDHDSFQVREKAQKQLIKNYVHSEPVVRAALLRPITFEQRARCMLIISVMDGKQRERNTAWRNDCTSRFDVAFDVTDLPCIDAAWRYGVPVLGANGHIYKHMIPYYHATPHINLMADVNWRRWRMATRDWAISMMEKGTPLFVLRVLFLEMHRRDKLAGYAVKKELLPMPNAGN